MQFRSSGAMQLLHSSHSSCRLMKPVSHNVPQKGTKTIHRLPFPRTTPSRTPAARSGRAHCQHSTLGPTARAVADQIHDDPRATHLADEVRARTAQSEVQHCSNSQRAHGASLHGRVDAAQQLRPTAQTLEELGRDFDWKGQWYPVSFTCNLREGAVIELPLAHDILCRLAAETCAPWNEESRHACGDLRNALAVFVTGSGGCQQHSDPGSLMQQNMPAFRSAMWLRVLSESKMSAVLGPGTSSILPFA